MGATVIIPKTVETPVAKADKPTGIIYNPTYQMKDKAGKPKGDPFPTLAVGPVDSEVNGGFAGNLEKWKRVMGLDKDGDPVIGEIFKVLYMNAKTEEEKEALIDKMAAAFTAMQKFIEEQRAQTA